MKQIAGFTFKLTRRRVCSLRALTLGVFVILIASIFVTAPSQSSGCSVVEPQNCKTAIARLQQALTNDAHALVDARRTQCQILALPEADRTGRPQAINDVARRKLLAALDETATATDAARNCDTSSIKKPKISAVDANANNAYETCFYERQANSWEFLVFWGLRSPKPLNCDKLAEQLDCAALINARVEDDPAKEQADFVPPSVKPECLDAYLQFKAAQREYERAHQYERQTASTYGTAGGRGTAILNSARTELSKASVKKNEAERKLEECAAPRGGPTCKLEGRWTQTTPGIGTTDWYISPDGTAKERGIGNAEGKAILTGNKLHIDWTTVTNYEGYYEWELDANCAASVDGKLQFKTPRTDMLKSSVKRN
jgi:hypothetical protein